MSTTCLTKELKPKLIHQAFLDKNVLRPNCLSVGTCDLGEHISDRRVKQSIHTHFSDYFQRQLRFENEFPFVLCLQNVTVQMTEDPVWKNDFSSYTVVYDAQTQVWSGIRSKRKWSKHVRHALGLYTTFGEIGFFNMYSKSPNRLQTISRWNRVQEFLKTQQESKILLVGLICPDRHKDEAVLRRHFEYLPTILPDTQMKRWTSSLRGPVRRCGQFTRKNEDVWDQMILSVSPVIFSDNRVISIGRHFSMVLGHFLYTTAPLSLPVYSGVHIPGKEGYLSAYIRKHVGWYTQLQKQIDLKYRSLLEYIWEQQKTRRLDSHRVLDFVRKSGKPTEMFENIQTWGWVKESPRRQEIRLTLVGLFLLHCMREQK